MTTTPSVSGPRESPLEASRRLGRYEALVKLASGGMATVYLGRATATGGFERLVAIKRCHEHLKDDDEFRTMFLDEARLAARIHHPNVVATLDVQHGEELFLVMEYVEGGRVSDLTKAAKAAGTTVPVAAILRCTFDALVGLHAAHTQVDAEGRPLDIVHRDVSPHNLLVGVDGVTRVVDFGVAKAKARATVTQDSRVKGKLAYMAPEQIAGKEVTARSDVFAAGVVLWEMLTGERCFRGDSESDLVQRVMFMPIPRPSSKRPDVTPELDAIVMRALERDPAARFATALDFARALERSGERVASHLEVSELVRSLLGPRLEARLEALRTASRLAVAATGEASGAGDDEVVSAVVATAKPARLGARTLAIAALGAVAVAGIAVFFLPANGSSEQGEGARGLPEATAAPEPAIAAPREERHVHPDGGAARGSSTEPDPTAETHPTAEPERHERRRRPRRRPARTPAMVDPAGTDEPASTEPYRPPRI